MTQNNSAGKKESKRVPYHFGEKLRMVREHKGMTLKVVAEKAGVSESLVSQIERNKVSPAIDTLLALADALDINLEFYSKNIGASVRSKLRAATNGGRFRKTTSYTKNLQYRTDRKKKIGLKRTQ